MTQLMNAWSEDFAGCSTEEIIRAQIENRAWGKELRDHTGALVNNRLAKRVSQADYLTTRDLVREATMECRRRAMILDQKISQRPINA